jgi:hypothetical protein
MDFIAIVKEKARREITDGNHKPVHIPNTVSKIEDMAMLQQVHAKHVAEMTPQQLEVGAKFAANLLMMGIRMILRFRDEYILSTIDFRNVYNVIEEVNVFERHKEQ